MGKKSKKHGNRPDSNDLFLYAQRAMEKQDFKEALKNAKVCFRQDASHEHRQILERAWLARGLQLARAGLAAEGRAAAQELLALGVSEAEVQKGMPELLLTVGLYDQAVTSGKISGGAQEADPAVLARAADRAVADPASAPGSLAGIREGAMAVRKALDALYEGNEDAALAALGDVPRNSPFAEWRLFVRGLAAYYRHDNDSMRANWDRLAADRFPARLAAPLRRLADPGAADGSSESGRRDAEGFRQAIRVLEADLFGGPVVWYLESLRKSLRENHWREAVSGVRRWKKDFRAMLPRLVERLDRVFYDMAVRKGNSRWLDELATALDPPRWDPRWNRARAIIADKNDDDDIGTIERFWLAYMDDLAAIPDLKPDERTLAQAMIWHKLGRYWADEADSYDDDAADYDEDYFEDEEGVQDRGQAARDRMIECLNRAISLAPTLAITYHDLAGRYVEWEQEDAAVGVYRRLLAQVPDDIDAIIFLFKHYAKHDEPLVARDYALRARRLKPASEQMLGMVVWGHLSAARALSIAGRVDDAQAELTAAEAAGRGPDTPPYDVTVGRAMVEFKAGRPEAGRGLVDQALKESDDPADVYLALSIEAVRYELPFALDGLPQHFRDRWQASLKKRRSRSAGPMSRRMAALMHEFEEFAGKYAFLNDYLERLIKYVGGCSRIRWQPADLLDVCRFFKKVVDDREFREVRARFVKFLDLGRKKFPGEPEFHLERGQIEIRRGPSYCNRRLARECFKMAIETAKTSGHREAEAIQKMASRRLRLLDQDGGPTLPRQPAGATSDFAGAPQELIDAGLSPEKLIEVIQRMCKATGLDPKHAVEEIMGELGVETAKGRQ